MAVVRSANLGIGRRLRLPAELQEFHRAHPSFVNGAGPQLLDQRDQFTTAQVGMGPGEALSDLADRGHARAEMLEIALQVTLLMVGALRRPGSAQLLLDLRGQTLNSCHARDRR